MIAIGQENFFPDRIKAGFLITKIERYTSNHKSNIKRIGKESRNLWRLANTTIKGPSILMVLK